MFLRLDMSRSIASLLIFTLSSFPVTQLSSEGPFSVRYEGLRIALNEPYRLSEDNAIGKTGPYMNRLGCSFYVRRQKANAKLYKDRESFHKKFLDRLVRRMEAPDIKVGGLIRRINGLEWLYSELDEQGGDAITAQYLFTSYYGGYHYSVLFSVFEGSELLCAKTVAGIAFFYE